jgi:cell division protein ZapB
MSKLEDLAERVDRLVLRHEELKRTNALLEQQLGAVSAERDSLRSRLAAARARIDALLERLPQDSPGAPAPNAHPTQAPE